MKTLKFSIILSYTLFLCSCFNYRDMNKLFFSTTFLVDIDETGNPIIYTEAFKANRGGPRENGTEIRVVFKGTGKTIFDAYNNLLLSASNEINTSQIKALIFTENAARLGIDNFIDIFERYQKPSIRMFLFVYSSGGNPENLLNLSINDEPFLGLFLDSLMTSQGRLSKIHRIRLNEYLNERLLGGTVSAIPIINKSKEQPMRIEIDGAAVMKNDKMVDILSPDEVVPYNYVTHNGVSGVLLADNPNAKDQLVSLVVLRNYVKVNINYDGNTISVNKKARIITTLVESQNNIFLLNDNVRSQIELSAERNLRYRCTKLFNDYKGRGIDIYNITQKFEIKYPGYKLNDLLSITELKNVDIDIRIEGSNNTTDFK